jgi:hypothetical protein
MTEVSTILALFDECKCEAKFTIESHGEDYALYYGRCGHHHGYNLVNMVDHALNFDPKHIEKLINLGHKHYQEDGKFTGHMAD